MQCAKLADILDLPVRWRSSLKETSPTGTDCSFLARESEIKPRSGLQAEKKITQRERLLGELTRGAEGGSIFTGGRFSIDYKLNGVLSRTTFCFRSGHKAAVTEDSLWEVCMSWPKCGI